MVPGKKIFKVLLPYNRHGSHIVHVTCKMLLNFINLYLQAYIQHLVENGPVVSNKRKLNFNL